jgi:hypothetical protein
MVERMVILAICEKVIHHSLLNCLLRAGLVLLSRPLIMKAASSCCVNQLSPDKFNLLWKVSVCKEIDSTKNTSILVIKSARRNIDVLCFHLQEATLLLLSESHGSLKQLGSESSVSILRMDSDVPNCGNILSVFQLKNARRIVSDHQSSNLSVIDSRRID